VVAPLELGGERRQRVDVPGERRDHDQDAAHRIAVPAAPTAAGSGGHLT
jgi:hypothetical protein